MCVGGKAPSRERPGGRLWGGYKVSDGAVYVRDREGVHDFLRLAAIAAAADENNGNGPCNCTNIPSHADIHRLRVDEETKRRVGTHAYNGPWDVEVLHGVGTGTSSGKESRSGGGRREPTAFVMGGTVGGSVGVTSVVDTLDGMEASTDGDAADASFAAASIADDSFIVASFEDASFEDASFAAAQLGTVSDASVADVSTTQTGCISAVMILTQSASWSCCRGLNRHRARADVVWMR